MDIPTARFRLYNKSPFFGTIIFNLPVEYTDKIKTLGVDGEKLLVNESHWESYNNKHKLGVFSHEISHLVLDHINRIGNRKDVAVDPQTGEAILLWNIAADFVVNLLVKEMLGRDYINSNWLYDEKYIGWNVEKIYDDLKKNMKTMSKSQLQQMLNGRTGDDSKWGQKKGKARKEAQAKMKQVFRQAMEAQKTQGDIPAGLRRMFDELEPKEDWRKVLMEYIQPFVNDYTFARPDRRFLEEDFFLPDIKEGEKVDWIAIGMDTSGSIGKKELDHFVSEVKAILGSFDKVKIKITFCDTVATPFVEMDEYDPKLIKPVGGGGTDFVPVFDLIKKEESLPQALIYLTDMMGNFPNSRPPYDVIWLSTTGRSYKPPFGKLLEYDI